MKAVVDHDICIGCGLCTGICPEVFSMNDDGLSVAIGEEIEAGLQATAQEAESGCPVDAITIE